MLSRALPIAVAAVLLAAAPALAAPTWLPARTLQADEPNGIVGGSVAVAANGTAFVTWTGDVGGHDIARVRIRPAGGQDFGPPIDLTAKDGRDAFVADVAVDGGGNATVVWDEEKSAVSTERQLRAARITPDGAVDTLTDPISPGAADAHDPVVAVNPAGRAVVAYVEGTSLFTVRALARNAPTGSFGGPQSLAPSIEHVGTPLEVGMADDGSASVAWSQNPNAAELNRRIVMVADRGSSGSFGPADEVDKNLLGETAAAPSLAVAPNGTAIVLWQVNPFPAPGNGRIDYSVRGTTGGWLDDPLRASPLEDENALDPHVAILGSGSVLATWFGKRTSDASATVQARTASTVDGGFGATAQLSTTPGFGLRVAGNRAGDGLLTWNSNMSDVLRSVRRTRAGDFGPVQTVATGGGTNPAIAIFNEDVGLDDEGNGAAVWTRNLVNSAAMTNVYDIQSAAQDAAPPTLAAVAVPPNGQALAPIGMAAAASDRLTPISFHWDFGDGTAADGNAVSHAFGAAGAFTVNVRVTDGVGNAVSAARSVLVTQAPPPPRIDATVQNSWGRLGKNFFLLRLKIIAPPKGSAAQIRCKGRKCPFQSRRFTKFKKGNIVMYKLLGPKKAVKKKNRHFRAKQVVQVRVTAPGYIGKVVKFKLKRGRNPVGKVLCLPPGAAKPSKCT
jgi:hypothetical protein